MPLGCLGLEAQPLGAQLPKGQIAALILAAIRLARPRPRMTLGASKSSSAKTSWRQRHLRSRTMAALVRNVNGSPTRLRKAQFLDPQATGHCPPRAPCPYQS